MLLPEDDYPVHQVALPLAHAMGGHPNGYDRFWFNGYTEDIYFAGALGLYPNRGVIDGAFSVSVGTKQHSVFAGDELRGRPTAVGPLRIEIVEPFRVNRLVVNAPEHGLAADLVFTRRTDAFEEPRQTLYDGSRIFLDTARATQFGTWEGWIESPDGRIDVPAGTWGTKDRSWGIRPLADSLPGVPSSRPPQLCFMWAPLHFRDGAVHYMSFDDDTGQPFSRTGATVPLADEGAARTHPSSLTVVPQSGSRRARRAVLTMGEREIELTPVRTFLMRGAGYSHPLYAHGKWHDAAFVASETIDLTDVNPTEYANLHVQQVVRARRGDDDGWGVLESFIVGPYAPMGLTGLFDGA